MGIRFYCPQGHKLNVKTFLAGKKGICPHCNAKVDIPLSSTRPSSKEERQAARAARAVPTSGPAARPTGPAARLADAPAMAPPLARPVIVPTGSAPLALPVGSGPGAPAGAALATLPPAAATAFGSAGAAAAFGGAGPAANSKAIPAHSPPPVDVPHAMAGGAAADPIAAAPHAVWYVRPASGGQFGPASGDVLRQWIDQGRVAADSLVWRDGWPGWQRARDSFSQLARGGGPAPAAASPPTAVSAGYEPDLIPPDPQPTAGQAALRRHSHARERSDALSVMIVVFLALVVLGLGGLLFYVLVLRP